MAFAFDGAFKVDVGESRAIPAWDSFLGDLGGFASLTEAMEFALSFRFLGDFPDIPGICRFKGDVEGPISPSSRDSRMA